MVERETGWWSSSELVWGRDAGVEVAWERSWRKRRRMRSNANVLLRCSQPLFLDEDGRKKEGRNELDEEEKWLRGS